MNLSDISLTPSSRTLRQFAGLWIVVLTAAACWQGLVREREILGLILAGLAITVGPLGLVKPQAIRWIFVGAQFVTFPIGWVLSRVLLAVVFYGVFTPVAVVFRLIGRDALGKKRLPDQPTYWTPKPAAADARSYFRQF